MAGFAVVVAVVVEGVVVPVASAVATGALAGPVTIGRRVAGQAIGESTVIDTDIPPVGHVVAV